MFRYTKIYTKNWKGSPFQWNRFVLFILVASLMFFTTSFRVLSRCSLEDKTSTWREFPHSTCTSGVLSCAVTVNPIETPWIFFREPLVSHAILWLSASSKYFLEQYRQQRTSADSVHSQNGYSMRSIHLKLPREFQILTCAGGICLCTLQPETTNRDHCYQSGFVGDSRKVRLLWSHRPVDTQGRVPHGTALKLVTNILASDNIAS